MRTPDPADFPGVDPAQIVPGSLVFTPTEGPVPLDDWTRWWRWVPGADWRHPEGPASTLHGRELHPVVHVALEDAAAYAAWANARLPTEAEWEHAARGGLDQATSAWGDDPEPGGKVMANRWYGRFPWEQLRPHGFKSTSPVKRFPANGFGLYDVTGNVWEWTSTAWDDVPDHHGCCAPNATQVRESDRAVIKGGSHLCAPSYCLRYRPAARQARGCAARPATSASAASDPPRTASSTAVPTKPHPTVSGSDRNSVHTARVLYGVP
jgi:sulfatase modifying factor 1